MAAQFHSNYVEQFMKLIGEYIRFSFGLEGREQGRYPLAKTTLQFTRELCRLGSLGSGLEEHVPRHILDTL